MRLLRAFSLQARRLEEGAGRRAFTSPYELDGRSYLLPTLRLARPTGRRPAPPSPAPSLPRKRTAVVLDLQLVSSDGSPHSQSIKKHELRAELEHLQSAGFEPVGVTNASDDVKEVAARLQLPYFISTRLSLQQQQQQQVEAVAASPVAASPQADAAASSQAETPMEAAMAQEQAPLVVTRSVRSGQQIYAQQRSLVVLGGVSSGAEVLADGSIYILGALKGRALAGIGGHTGARIFCHSFDAELVSIAHHFTTCDDLAREDSEALRPREPTAVSLLDDRLVFESAS